MTTLAQMKRNAAKTWYVIASEDDVERLAPFTAAGEGHEVRFVSALGAVICENCGSELDTGRKNGEDDRELAARLGTKRPTLVEHGGVFVKCVSCGREYDVTEDGPITDQDLSELGTRGLLPKKLQAEWTSAVERRKKTMKAKPKKTTRTAAQIAASLTGNAQALKEGHLSLEQMRDLAAADWAAADRSERLNAEVHRILREDYHANAMGEPLAPAGSLEHAALHATGAGAATIKGRDGKTYPAVIRIEPYAGMWRVQGHPELPTFSFRDGPEAWASYWAPGAEVVFVERENAQAAARAPECEHCALPIKGEPVTFRSEGKTPVHYHPHHAHHHRV
jgi:hypothetical protein